MKHLFLDLEDTVITPVGQGWHTGELINIDRVRELIATEKPDFVSLFSFALHNRAELADFDTHIRWGLERALDIRLNMTPTMDDHIIPACCRSMNLRLSTVSFADAVEFWSKHQAFRLFVLDKFKLMNKTWNMSTEVILLDDAVANETWEWPDLRITGKIIRV